MLVRNIRNNFASGELTEKLQARTDTDAWKSGARAITNMRVMDEGGVTTRPGSDYKAALTNATTDSVLIPFAFSDSQGYVIVLSPLLMDIYYDDGTIAVASTVTVFTAGQLAEVNYDQVGDTMFLTHPVAGMFTLVRTGAATFGFSAFAFDTSGGTPDLKLCVFDKFGSAAVTMTAGATSGTGISLTASAATFVAGHVGLRFRLVAKQVQITAVTTSTVAVMTVIDTLTAITATMDWDEEAFSAVRGYPAAVCMHNDRLMLAGSTARSNGVWGSQVGEYFNFDLGTSLDSEAVWTGIAAAKVVKVHHLASHGALHAFCDGSEQYTLESSQKVFAASNNAFKARSAYGADIKCKPQIFHESVMFVQKHGLAVRQLEAEDKPGGEAASMLFSHRILAPRSMSVTGSLRGIAEQYMFVCMEAGGMAGLHTVPRAGTVAWFWMTTDGKYRAVASVNGRVFTLVERTINSVTKFYLEEMNFAHALDCSVTKTVTVDALTASGLSHLEAKTVSAVSDDGYNGDAVVASAVGTWADPWTLVDVRIGLRFVPTLTPMPVVTTLPGSGQNSLGLLYRIVKAYVAIYETVRLQATGQSLWVRNVNDDMSLPPAAKTGTYEFTFLGWSANGAVTITNDVPLPLTILAITLDVEF